MRLPVFFGKSAARHSPEPAMSMTIAPRTTAVAAPQVRSRSVSLRLGPFGITYASDQVLWGESAATATAASAASVANAAVADQNSVPVTPIAAITPEQTSEQASAQASSQTDTAATQAARRFSSDLEAARKQAMFQRMADNGAGSQAGLSATSRVQAATSSDAGEEDKSSAEAGSQSGAGQRLAGNAATNRPATARVRQAISAYLSCAASFGQGASMIRAVA